MHSWAASCLNVNASANAPGHRARGPARDEEYRAWIRTLACCTCGAEERSEAAHKGEDGGISMKASDYSRVPLCPDCHTRERGVYNRIHKRAFERSHGLSFETLVARLNQKWRERSA
jgi:hypothetical protein